MEKKRKVRTGRVISDKMEKTVVVRVETIQQHPLYRRMLRRAKKFMAHDPESACHLGDWVRIEETRPLSKTKRWRVVEVLVRGQVAEVQPAEIGRELEAPAPSETENTKVEDAENKEGMP
ncbi:MAG: 30S ribosomal protein S17 [Chloroflexi bacterium]|nr:30S ribosomal protein S17 [Chloroflexota bacterium]